MADRQSSGETSPLLEPGDAQGQNSSVPLKTKWAGYQETSRGYLESKQKHYVILALVTLDVAAVLTEILVSLVTCDMGTENEPWVDEVKEATRLCSLVFGCLFLVELILTVWAFGIE